MVIKEKGYYYFNRGSHVEYYFYYDGSKVIAKTSYLDEGNVIWKRRQKGDSTSDDYYFRCAQSKLNPKQMKLKGLPLFDESIIT